MNNTVNWLGLAVSLPLVAVAAGISWWQRLGLQRQILVAATRALAQLLLVGAALTLIISPGRSIWWSWLWVAAMLGYAATVARRRGPRGPASASAGPGLLHGGGGRHLGRELRDKRDEVEARLALGQASRQAATPYVRAALRAALTPQIEMTKATGLVFLPGAVTGLILAGAAPLQAVLVQAVVMFLVLAATSTTTVVIALGLIRRLFTPGHRLMHLPAPAGR
jgi:putative ABC transport system permease protein